MVIDDMNEQAVNEKNTTENSAENSNKDNQSEEKMQSAENDSIHGEDIKSSKKKKSGKHSDLEKKENELIEMRYKLSDINDRYLRLSAEFDNFRKRSLKEKADLIKTAGGDTLVDMLPVVDDFERAMQAMESAVDIVAVKDGIGLIYTKFKDFMKNKGIVEIDAVNQDFNTDLHEALVKIPAPDDSLKGKVIEVVQKGYKIDEKVIRYAKVVIGE
ncbi:MAG: nucleotide exchange factor GrpE [Salinivirgaceae bacterium]|jgi:molecular chaperone GrpE